ncbi:hypothetical protein PVAND_000416 [Polypedilum vanderplanki]|uniref:Uncharacterized protein n=1 Tax=Polypedilum vanderplanki TaxID=319348 RepID=A0A9J6BL83_POLVA|nr:hypothetical protein PVAND_000416 [Polypedilum vanderplanki]
MDKKIFLLFILNFSIFSVESKTLILNQKEIQQILSTFKEALDRHKIMATKEISFTGLFDCLSPNDCEITFDINLTNTENGALSGNDLLNGIGNGNGNDNGHNGNNNGNVILQIFNIPIDEIPTTSTTERTTTTNMWWPKAGLTT